MVKDVKFMQFWWTLPVALLMFCSSMVILHVLFCLEFAFINELQNGHRTMINENVFIFFIVWIDEWSYGLNDFEENTHNPNRFRIKIVLWISSDRWMCWVSLYLLLTSPNVNACAMLKQWVERWEKSRIKQKVH